MSVIEYHGIKFVESSARADKRARTFYEKEPGTTKWIEAFTKDDIFFDIGANIGIYTLFAAPRVFHVYAFEPHVGNAHQLLLNIQANEFKNVSVITTPLHNRTGWNSFHYSNLDIGTPDNQVDNNARSVAHELKYCISLNALDIAWQATKIKLDVDGNEMLILDGAEKILRSGEVTEVIVEHNPGNNTIEKMNYCGFDYVERQLTASGKKWLQAANGDYEKVPHNILFRKRNNARPIGGNFYTEQTKAA
jgi:FkbM family methyltransferase